jgi:hypothetical protein
MFLADRSVSCQNFFIFCLKLSKKAWRVEGLRPNKPLKEQQWNGKGAKAGERNDERLLRPRDQVLLDLSIGQIAGLNKTET